MTHKLHPHPPSRVKSTILLLFLTNCAFLPHKMEKKNDNHTIFSHSDTKAWRYGIKVGGRGSLGGGGVALGKGRNTREGHREWRGGTGRRQGISGASVCCWTHFSLTPASQSRWPDPGPGPPQASARSSVFSSLWGRERRLITIISYTISTWSATRGISATLLQHCMKQDIYPVETTSLRILHLYTKQSVTHIFGFGNYTDYQNNPNSSLNQTAYYKPKPNPKTTPKHFTQ